MKFLIGTKNSEKVATAEVVIQQIVKTQFTLEGVDVPSGFGETPIGEETKTGAYNRATALVVKQCDYAIGIESGLVERYGDTYEEAWCCIVTKNRKTFFGYSSGLMVPDLITEKMQREELEHFEVMRTEEIRALLPVRDRRDTWANYSAQMIARRLSFEESLRNALVQIFAPEDSLYHL
jgi:non-canonical (house-cleaning) NTP pyrophosphatase